MKVIGLTGGIASGKSTVSNYLKELGAIVIDADVVSREIVEKGKPALKEIVNFFGEKVLKSDGTLNRKYLGSIVFSDPQKLQVLNKITHKRIIEKIEDEIKYYRHSRNIKAIFIDAALLIEMKMYYLTDEIWLVTTSKEIQLRRLMLRDNITFEEAMNRINSQMSLDQKKDFSDVIIDNSKDFDYLKNQVKELYTNVFGGA
ncbi:dephospho-CoA kinase [Paramaledivibacter caminithermalis]|jgi:dephospho-CoA kinase|uniref:Dephospho-CoA kinase n=1 Tax=Paramaledivibacter caminithermalis (strain DSM 15212 / CIP 107654 / DViRD3) TaxID=1121301 RepID=A0A1M6ME44_PARC5|nr:dephospho-CoA kinase [Paramaledivibacter caminithermalis]SHJ81729.1 dephospho-CoA kinase [Paramaledivibacter caminithermalis DSM 15212]